MAASPAVAAQQLKGGKASPLKRAQLRKELQLDTDKVGWYRRSLDLLGNPKNSPAPAPAPEPAPPSAATPPPGLTYRQKCGIVARWIAVMQDLAAAEEGLGEAEQVYSEMQRARDEHFIGRHPQGDDYEHDAVEVMDAYDGLATAWAELCQAKREHKSSRRAFEGFEDRAEVLALVASGEYEELFEHEYESTAQPPAQISPTAPTEQQQSPALSTALTCTPEITSPAAQEARIAAASHDAAELEALAHEEQQQLEAVVTTDLYTPTPEHYDSWQAVQGQHSTASGSSTAPGMPSVIQWVVKGSYTQAAPFIKVNRT